MFFKKKKTIVSACLAGIKCRYNGSAATDKKVIALLKKGEALPLCPEQLGGLATPRPPVEKVGSRFLDEKGNDYTASFKKGAKEALKIVEMVGCQKAILKANSPSCGWQQIYDGSFSGKKKKGNGCFADLLAKKGIKISCR